MFDFIVRNENVKSRTWKHHIGVNHDNVPELLIWDVAGQLVYQGLQCPECGFWSADMYYGRCRCQNDLDNLIEQHGLIGTYKCKEAGGCIHQDKCRHGGGDNTFIANIRNIFNGDVDSCHSYYNKFAVLSPRIKIGPVATSPKLTDEQKTKLPVLLDAALNSSVDHSSYIKVYEAIGGWQTMLLFWDDKDGFWDVWNTGFGPYRTRKEAVDEAIMWAYSDEVRFPECQDLVDTMRKKHQPCENKDTMSVEAAIECGSCPRKEDCEEE